MGSADEMVLTEVLMALGETARGSRRTGGLAILFKRWREAQEIQSKSAAIGSNQCTSFSPFFFFFFFILCSL